MQITEQRYNELLNSYSALSEQCTFLYSRSFVEALSLQVNEKDFYTIKRSRLMQPCNDVNEAQEAETQIVFYHEFTNEQEARNYLAQMLRDLVLDEPLQPA